MFGLVLVSTGILKLGKPFGETTLRCKLKLNADNKLAYAAA